MPMAKVSFARPANTTAYTAADVIGAADTVTAANAGSAVLSFSGAGRLACDVFITTATLQIDLAAVPSGMTSFRLHLYASAPTAILDNAAWALSSANDKSFYLGYIDLGTPAVIGSVLFVQTDGINKQLSYLGGYSPSGGYVGLYGELVTNGGYTPASGTTYTVTLNTTLA